MQKRISALVAPLALALLVASPLAAQECEDLSGDWNVSINTPNGIQDVTMNLEQDGCSVTGKIVGNNENEVKDGVVEGSKLTFLVTLDTEAGALDFNWDATVDGDSMSGTWGNEMVGTFEFQGTRADD